MKRSTSAGQGGGQQFLEAAGVDVAGEGDGAAFVGGVDDADFGGVGGHAQRADVVDDEGV